MWRGLAVVVLVLAGVALLPESASACSCGWGDPREMLENGSAAFVGKLIHKEEPEVSASGTIYTGSDVTYTFEIEQVLKGDLGESVEVESPLDGAACGFEVAEGQRIGVVLRREGGVWKGGLCSTVPADALIRASQPIPPPDGEGPVAMLIADPTSEAAVIALDTEGRVLAYLEGETDREVQMLASCPGSERVVELVFEGPYPRIAVRNLRTLAVEHVLRPDGLVPGFTAMSCTSPDGQTVLIHDTAYVQDGTKIRIMRVQGDEATIIYEAASESQDYGRVAFDTEHGMAYIVDPENAFRILGVDLQSGEARVVATLIEPEREFGGISVLAVNPSGTRLVADVTLQTPSELLDRMYVIDLTTDSASVHEVTDETYSFTSASWISDDRVMVNGYRDGTQDTLVFDGAGTHIRTISDLWLGYVVTRGDVVYGIGNQNMGGPFPVFPSLFSITMPDGEPAAIRPIDSPYVGDIIAVPDDIEIEAAPAVNPPEPASTEPPADSTSTQADNTATPENSTALPAEATATPVESGQVGGEDDPSDSDGVTASTDSGPGIGTGEMVVGGLVLGAVAVGGWLMLRRWRHPEPAAESRT